MIRTFLFTLTCLILMSCNTNPEKDTENVAIPEKAFSHLDYLITLKDSVAVKHWPDFAGKEFFQPLVYHTWEGAYVINPTPHILTLTDHSRAGSFKQAPVIRLPEEYRDTTNLNFATSYSDTDSTALYYRANTLTFQSFDLTRKFIPDITDLQDWSIMVIHELFHGYQVSIPEIRKSRYGIEMPGGPDKFLGLYHRDLDWYKESVEKENEILKGIWIDDRDPGENLRRYDSLRTIRIDRIKKEYGVDIRPAEDYELLIEGHARYFESHCKRYLAGHPTDTSMLSDDDKSYLTDMFKGYEVDADKALHNIYNDRYWYQLGYNISMILEKYLPEFKETLYYKEQNFNTYLEQLKK